MAKLIQVELKKKDDWVKINAGQHTLMRVLYTPEMNKRLEAGVRDRSLTPEVSEGTKTHAHVHTNTNIHTEDTKTRSFPPFPLVRRWQTRGVIFSFCITTNVECEKELGALPVH